MADSVRENRISFFYCLNCLFQFKLLPLQYNKTDFYGKKNNHFYFN